MENGDSLDNLSLCFFRKHLHTSFDGVTYVSLLPQLVHVAVMFSAV